MKLVATLRDSWNNHINFTFMFSWSLIWCAVSCKDKNYPNEYRLQCYFQGSFWGLSRCWTGEGLRLTHRSTAWEGTDCIMPSIPNHSFVHCKGCLVLPNAHLCNGCPWISLCLYSMYLINYNIFLGYSGAQPVMSVYSSPVPFAESLPSYSNSHFKAVNEGTVGQSWEYGF